MLFQVPARDIVWVVLASLVAFAGVAFGGKLLGHGQQLTLRLDADVLEWLKSQGKGYQSRINAILRAYYEAHRKDAG